MFSKRRTDAASPKAAPTSGANVGRTAGRSFGQVGQNAQRSVLSAAVTRDPKAAKESAKAA